MRISEFYNSVPIVSIAFFVGLRIVLQLSTGFGSGATIVTHTYVYSGITATCSDREVLFQKIRILSSK